MLPSSRSPSAPPRTVPPPRLCVTGGLTQGIGAEEPRRYAVNAEVICHSCGGACAWRRRRDGPDDEPTRPTPSTRSYTAAVGRLLAGGGFGPLELFGGPFAAAYSITGATRARGRPVRRPRRWRASRCRCRAVRLSLVATARSTPTRIGCASSGRTAAAYATPRLGADDRRRPRPGIGVVTRASTVPIRRPSPAAEAAEDARLVAAAEAGDRGAFDKLYRRHLDSVYARLTRVIGPAPERDDLVQQIFLDVYRAMRRFRGDASFATFLHRIVLNVAAEHLERRRRGTGPKRAGGRAPAGDADRARRIARAARAPA